MTLPLELGGNIDPQVRRALETLSQQFPIAAAGGGGAPSGPAGGVLGGTYPNPSFAADMATQVELDAHTTQTTAAHGGIVASTDPRLTDARTPTAHKASHEPGGSDAMTVDAAAATGSLRTLGTGASQAAAGNDARLSDTRTPSALSVVDASVSATAAIAESKLNLATDAAAGTGSRRTLGTTATSAAAGNRGLPAGGTSGQALTKNSANDYDVGWTTPAGGGSVFYDDLQQGVVGAGDCALTVNTTAQVTAAAGTVYVTASGVLTRAAPGSTVMGSIPAASASNFRLDQVVVSSTGTISRLQGTQGTTVTLANRTGAAAVPAGSMLLHDILVTATGVTAANVRDRRLRARGAFSVGTRTTAVSLPGVVAPGSELDTTNWKVRVECSGVPVRLTLGPASLTIIAANNASLRFWMDGADLANSQGVLTLVNNTTANLIMPASFVVVFTPAAGSHLFSVAGQYQSGASAPSLAASNFAVEEVVRPSANNGIV